MAILKSVYTRDYRILVYLLRKRREEIGVDQAQVAQRLERTQSFVSKCERGERRLDVIELQEFCKALDIKLSDFVRQLEEAQELSTDELLKYLGEEWP